METVDLDQLVFALGEQVTKAVPAGGSELDVTTFITLRMWDMFCVAMGLSSDTVPTEWIGKDTIRVWGSKTMVIDSASYWAFSIASHRLNLS